MTRPQPRYQPGDRIGGRYQVHQVKLGGMGEVYLCLDLETIQPFALKTFQQRYQSAALRKAFEQEVATWVALEKHPNIVRRTSWWPRDRSPRSPTLAWLRSWRRPDWQAPPTPQRGEQKTTFPPEESA